ncbi:MAG TPA: heme ABC exporter ATP-binding protein CcmA [Acidimicrobiales bacterium]|nr:heme ABC exporter ATP-binding protein CcmA [Acidimicrobiales bacterium]
MALAVSLREAVALADRFPLLAGVTLDVGEGEIVHLSGPNGAGKSSLLRLCCGLLPLAAGTGVVLGHDLAVDRREVRRRVGYLGHASFLYEELTVEENLRFALRASGLRSADAVQRAATAMARMGLSGRIPGTPVVKLSAGQRRRAALAVVVGRQPRLWLLDEPHAGLDQESRALLDDIVTEARADGATVVLSSHDLGSAGALADRVIVLAGGRVVPAAGTMPVSRTPVETAAPDPARQPIADQDHPAEPARQPVADQDHAPEAVHVA